MRISHLSTQQYTNNGKSVGLSIGKKARWVVTVPPTVPAWGLEKGSVQIDEVPYIVSARIDHCLRLRSVEAQFDANRAEATCKTSNSVQYKIYLYAGKSDGHNGINIGIGDGSSTIVEIVRMNKENVFLFKDERDAIMNAAKGFGAVTTKTNTFQTMTIPDDLLDSIERPSTFDLENILARASDQLHSTNLDVVIFALENVLSITTPDEHTIEAANEMSSLIMNNTNDIRDRIISTYATSLKDQSNNERWEKISKLSLEIFIYAISSLSLPASTSTSTSTDKQNTHGNRYLDEECNCYFVKQLVASLVEGVRDYTHSHTACLAMECLSLLVINSTTACTELKNTDITDLVQQAKTHGKMEHLKLEQTADTTMEKLRNHLVII